MIDFSFPTTLFSVILFTFGCLKLTVSSFATLNLFQFILALLEDWVISVTLPVCEIFADPEVTTPPLGAAKVSVVLDRNADTTRLIFPPFRIQKLFL